MAQGLGEEVTGVWGLKRLKRRISDPGGRGCWRSWVSGKSSEAGLMKMPYWYRQDGFCKDQCKDTSQDISASARWGYTLVLTSRSKGDCKSPPLAMLCTYIQTGMAPLSSTCRITLPGITLGFPADAVPRLLPESAREYDGSGRGKPYLGSLAGRVDCKI